MGGMWGADVKALRDLARSFGDGAQRLDEVRAALDDQVAQMAWEGADATAFADEWITYRAWLAAASASLAEGSRTIAANADAQEAASAADDVAVAPGTTLGAVGTGPAGGASNDSTSGTAAVFGAPGASAPGARASNDDWGDLSEDIRIYEDALEEAGLLRAPARRLYHEWLENAAVNKIPPDEIVAIAKEFNITHSDFEMMENLSQFTDQDGKSFFLIPDGRFMRVDVRRVALLTYIINVDTGYGHGDGKGDFDPTPYSLEEVRRIADRQEANKWSYWLVSDVNASGGRVVTTPNGMLMAAGGKRVIDLMSQRGGTTYGDLFLLNINDTDTPAQVLRDEVIRSGLMTYQNRDGTYTHGTREIDLDRILHHEEIHSQQWAKKGFRRMIKEYIDEARKGENTTEEEAGLSDGGY